MDRVLLTAGGRGGARRRGWLAGDEYRSQATADQLNETRFRGSGFYQSEICGGDGTPDGG